MVHENIGIPFHLAGCSAFLHSYGPRKTSLLGHKGHGYEESKLDENTWQVNYELDNKEEAERYLLYRCAEITVENGFDYFVTVSQTGNQEPVVTRTHNYAYSSQTYTTSSEGTYSTSARIRLFKGVKPADDLNALDAHAVLRNLGPGIRR